MSFHERIRRESVSHNTSDSDTRPPCVLSARGARPALSVSVIDTNHDTASKKINPPETPQDPRPDRKFVRAIWRDWVRAESTRGHGAAPQLPMFSRPTLVRPKSPVLTHHRPSYDEEARVPQSSSPVSFCSTMSSAASSSSSSSSDSDSDSDANLSDSDDDENGRRAGKEAGIEMGMGKEKEKEAVFPSATLREPVASRAFQRMLRAHGVSRPIDILTYMCSFYIAATPAGSSEFLSDTGGNFVPPPSPRRRMRALNAAASGNHPGRPPKRMASRRSTWHIVPRRFSLHQPQQRR